jgi:hypothetical protein
MSLDRALDGTPFLIDKFRCLDAAKMLAGYRAHEEIRPWSNASIPARLAFKTLFVSICHQMNWDVLQAALAGWMMPDTDRRLVEFAHTTPAQIRELLRDYPKQERVRAHERAKTLRDTAVALEPLLAPGGHFHQLLDEPRLAGAEGFYQVVSQIKAFQSDFLEKKARVLAHDLHREHIVRFADPENLKPAVEYHLIRLYLRTGRVFPTHEAVLDELRGDRRQPRPRLVHLLRATVDQAMRDTAFYAGLDVATLNYVEWQLARTICVAELNRDWHPLCLHAPRSELPEDVRLLVAFTCPYAEGCRALNDRGYDWFHEPQFEKAIY